MKFYPLALLFLLAGNAHASFRNNTEPDTTARTPATEVPKKSGATRSDAAVNSSQVTTTKALATLSNSTTASTNRTLAVNPTASEVLLVTGTSDARTTSVTDAVLSNKTATGIFILGTGTRTRKPGSTNATDALFANTTVAGSTRSASKVVTRTSDASTATANQTVKATPAPQATAIIREPSIIFVQQVTIFAFTSALGGLCPAVSANPNGPGTFLIGQQPFNNLGDACSRACNIQLTTCTTVAGTAFSVTDCMTQFTACMKAAQQAVVTQTVSVVVPTTITQTVILPSEAITASGVISHITSAGGSVISTASAVTAPNVVATIGESGVSLITVTKTALETNTVLKTTSLPAKTSVITSRVTMTVSEGAGAQASIRVTTVTMTIVAPPNQPSPPANPIVSVPNGVSIVKPTAQGTSAATVTKTVTMTLVSSACMATTTISICAANSKPASVLFETTTLATVKTPLAIPPEAPTPPAAKVKPPPAPEAAIEAGACNATETEDKGS